MVTTLWLFGLAVISFMTWLGAAFVLRLGHSMRLLLTLIVPGLVAGGKM